MRLLVVTECLPYGAGEAFIYPEIEWMLNNGIELRILPAFPVGKRIHQPERDFENLLLKRLDDGAKGLSRNEFLRMNFQVFKCRGGIVHNCRKFQINNRMARRARDFAKAVEDWKPDHIHSHWANYTATLAWCLSSQSGIPWSITTQRYDIVFDNLFRLKAENASFVRFPSKKARDLAEQFCKFSNSRRSMVNYMGVVIPDKPSCPRERDYLTVAVPANLLPVKGHRYLLEAIAGLNERTRDRLKVRLFGDGILREKLFQQIEILNLKKIVALEGQVSQTKLHQLYSQGEVDLVVLPSVDLGNGHHEGLPFSLIEAMAFGLPVISTRTGGIPELVVEGTGLLVTDKSARDLGDALEKLVSNRELRVSMGANARKRAMENFSQSVNLRKLLERMRSKPELAHDEKR